jgi:DNA-binding MarR family transcriptional regulator
MYDYLYMQPSRAYQQTARAYRKRGFECVCGDARMAARAVTRVYDRFFEPCGVGANQVSLLWAVMALEPAAVGTIAQAIHADATTLTRNLKVLERDGYLRLVKSDDRRERRYQLSAKGQALMVRALPQWERAQAHLERHVGKGFHELLGRLLHLATVA